MIPSKSDMRKREERIVRWKKMLNLDGYIPEKKMMQMLRSAVRQVWMHNPVKLLKLSMATYPDMDVNTRTKWLVDCECCGGSFKQGDVQVDHIKGGHSLKTVDDLSRFFENVLNVSARDLQILCKPCHEVKTYMESHPGMTREEAVIEKKVIAWFKKYPNVSAQKGALCRWCPSFNEADISNAVKRKAHVRSMLSG